MKIGGVDPKNLSSEEVLVLPRGDDQIVFKARGLTDWDEFTKLCPEPTPPGKLTRDGWVPNPEDKGYQSVLTEFNRKKLSWMVVKSLAPSQIEWDTVDVDNPRTWANWEAELKANGLTQVECNRVVGLVFEANSLDEGKLKKAREVFLRGPQQASVGLSFPTIELASSQSGEPVPVSA